MFALLTIIILGLSITAASAQNPAVPESCSAQSLTDSIRARFAQYEVETNKVTAWSDAAGRARALLSDLEAIMTACETQSLDYPVADPSRTIGIVSGHSGPSWKQNDSGAVCDDGLTEESINFDIATKVVAELRQRGFTVLLLDEFDPRLNGLEALALVSIHSNECTDYGEDVSGFLVGNTAAFPDAPGSAQLADCIGRHYAEATGLPRRAGQTLHMTDYHRFDEVRTQIPAVVIELGFMLNDRDILTNQQDTVARGLIEGISCFITPTIAPESTAEMVATEQP
jgi:N-acetylmuramoyl-L-alanine amidase